MRWQANIAKNRRALRLLHKHYLRANADRKEAFERRLQSSILSGRL